MDTKRKACYMMQRSFAEKLRVLRARRGLPMTVAAGMIGIDRHTLRNLELGETEPRYPTLEKISSAYGVPIEELVEEEPAHLGEAPPPGPSDAELEQQRRYARRLMDAGVSEATARELSGEFSRDPEYWRALAEHIGVESAPPARVEPGEMLERLQDLGIPTNYSEATIINLCIGRTPGAEAMEGAIADETRVFALLAYIIAEGMLAEDETEAARQTLRRKLTDVAPQGSYPPKLDERRA